MIEEIKILLGDAVENYPEMLINVCYNQALAEVEAYTNRKADRELQMAAQRIAIIKLNRIGTEGLDSQSYSGVNESYTDGYPADILAILNRKRKIKVV